jgi:hypothetical protein
MAHMTKEIFRLELLILSSLAFFMFSVAAVFGQSMEKIDSEKRIALVIGNNAYQTAPLANTVNDANDMASALEQCNFRVTKRLNCSRKDMREAIRVFGEQIQGGGVGLFYYAGHGVQIKGQNYLVPVGTELTREYEVEDECVNITGLLGAMEYAKNRLNIIILDACRNNPFQRSFRSVSHGLAKMDAPAGSYLAYATGPDSVAADGNERNGTYTAALLQHIRTEGIPIEDVFKKVRSEVMAKTSGQQVPWESSSLTGSFYFFYVPPGSKATVTVEKTNPVKPHPEFKQTVQREYVSGDSELNNIHFFSFANRFSQELDGSIYDSYLKKRWKTVENDEIFRRDQAEEYCTSYASGYRLPSLPELQTLITKDKNPAEWGKIDGQFFPLNNRTKKYWTNSCSTFVGCWYVDFSAGTWGNITKSSYCGILLIKD